MSQANGTSELTGRESSPVSSFDADIAAALTDENVTSAALARLILEAENAADAADEAAEKERACALDPATADPDKAQAMLQKIELGRDRLNAALPKLQARYEQARAREHSAQWAAEYERIEQKRDALAKELTAVYPEAVKTLTDLFERIEALDKEIGQLHGTAPRSDHRRLLGAELVARSMTGFTAINPPIARDLRLPHPGETSRLAWPPAPINFGALVADQVAGLMASRSACYGPDWAAAHEAENELRRADAVRAQARNERALEKEKQEYYAAQRVAEEYRRTGHKP
jgi:hypothetical protein